MSTKAGTGRPDHRGLGAALVFANAFLPDIAAPEERDSVSSRRWALGYLGGGVLLALNLLLVFHAAEPNPPDPVAEQI